MKILLFGKNGQVGQELLRTLAPLGQLVAPGRDEADFENPDALQKRLRETAADVIVNAAAFTDVDGAENAASRAFRVNAEAVGMLAGYARYNGSLLVHYSSDHVFDGEKDAPYTETDAPRPLNVYGRSKLAGEEAVFQAGCHHYIFRTSWVSSASGRNFIKNIWQLAREKDRISVVADQTGVPTSAELIADVTALSIAAFFADLMPEGLYHLAASGETSRYELARYILQKAGEAGVTMKLAPDGIAPVSSAAYPAAAVRPLNARLDNALLSGKLGFLLPHWTLHVDRLLDRLVRDGL